MCPAKEQTPIMPDFSGAGCKKGSVDLIDPQDTQIWVKTYIVLDDIKGRNGEPLSLYISGKMSSEVYLNGVLIGRNGRPDRVAANEVVGKMDAELFPAQDLLRRGDNEVVLRASSHHGFLHLHRPFHMVAIAPSGMAASGPISQLGPALITFGVFLLGGLYFGVMTIVDEGRIRFATLSAICLFAGGQLMSETMRNLTQYDYPVHDLRLIAIMLFSMAFGLAVAFHVLRSFEQKHLARIMVALTIISAAVVFGVPGFDYKALAGMTIPLLACLGFTGVWAYQRRPRAFMYFVVLLVFIVAIFVFQSSFLDTVFFLLVAFFLLILFVDQALTLIEEARRRRSEETRANRLEQAMAEAEERTSTTHIDVKSAGKIERIATNEILHCQGASGYTEIFLISGRTVLQAASLNEMEEALPATFLRVHRSHLINVMFVKALTRDPAGTGKLTLTQGPDIPVSRRIMPKVRQALK